MDLEELGHGCDDYIVLNVNPLLFFLPVFNP